jgi:CubicO group peptidase (beta-lactamase class C family)
MDTLTPTPDSYFWRYLLYNAVGQQDYKIFPARTIENQAPVFQFQSSPADDQLRRGFEQLDLALPEIRPGDTLEQFLEHSGTAAFLVVHNDRLVYEHYFNGYQRDSIVTSFSMVKSFVSALVGIALHEKRITSLDDPITHYLPRLRGNHWKAISIRHLLSMSSGLRYRQGGFLPWEDEPRIYYSPNLRQMALTAKRKEPPGINFHYNNINLLLLGMIIEEVTAGTVSHYLQECIWKPLGMEFPASWSMDSERSGLEKMESGLNGRAVDFIKFGRLYLNRGDWNGRQVVPQSWVDDSTRIPEGASWQRYRYLWWVPGGNTGQFMAVGNLGQFMLVSPATDTILLRIGLRGGLKGWQRAWPQILQNLNRSIS